VSKMQSVVAMSTTEAKYVAAAQANKEACHVSCKNPTFHSKTKHIRVQYHFVREKVEEGTVDMQKIHTDDNVADYMTKAINCDKFTWCQSSCGLAETQAQVDKPRIDKRPRINRFRVTDEEPEHFGDDALPRPLGLQRIAKTQRSGSNSTASSGSNPMMHQEFMKEQYELDHKAKMQVIEQESEERRQLIHSQRIAEDMKVLQTDTRGMDLADAVIINAQKARIRAAYPPPPN
ncbi:hypothetical protein Tco_1276725, partial [Tanacetum coccineum]